LKKIYDNAKNLDYKESQRTSLILKKRAKRTSLGKKNIPYVKKDPSVSVL